MLQSKVFHSLILLLSVIVAAAGSWCTGIKIEALQPGMCTQLTQLSTCTCCFCAQINYVIFFTQPVLADLKENSSNCVWSSLQPDPEELYAFTNLYGPLRLLLSFQVHPFSVTLDPPDFCTQENKNINILATGCVVIRKQCFVVLVLELVLSLTKTEL